MLGFSMKDILDRDSLSSYLPVAAYDSDKKLFYCGAEGAAGFIVEMVPIPYTGRAFYESMTSYLNAKWPKNTILQVILYADPNLDPILKPYKSYRGDKDSWELANDPVRSFLYSWSCSYADYLEAKKYEGIDKDQAPVCFRNFRTFFTAKIPCTEDAFNNTSHDLEKMLESREELMAAFQTCHINAKHIGPNQYLTMLYQLWNPDHPLPLHAPESEQEGVLDLSTVKRPYIDWDTSRPLSDQIISKTTRITRRPRSLTVDNWKVITKSLVGVPQQVEPIDINQLIGDLGRANKRQIAAPFLISLTLDMNPCNNLVTRQGSVVMGQQAPLPGLRPRLEKRKNELLRGNQILDKGGKFIRGIVSVALMGKNLKRLETVSATLDNIWKQRKYNIQNESCLHLPLYLFSQPLGASLGTFEKLRRSFPAPAESFPYLMPVQGDAATYEPKPSFLFISRRGQILGHNLRSSPRDSNAVVFAPTGSGKSFLVNYLAMNNRSVGGINYIIDIGRSYEKLCETSDGQYLEFTNKSKLCLNLFSLITPEIWLQDSRTFDDIAQEEEERLKNSKADDDEGIVDPKTLYSQMCNALLHQMVSPNELIDRLSQSILNKYMGLCYDELALEWRKKKYARTKLMDIMSEFQAYLKSNSEKAAEWDGNADIEPPYMELLPKESRIRPNKNRTDEQNNEIQQGLEELETEYELDNQVSFLKWLSNYAADCLDFEVSSDFFVHQTDALVDFMGKIIVTEIPLKDLVGLNFEDTLSYCQKLNKILKSDRTFSIDMMIAKLRHIQRHYDEIGRADTTPNDLAEKLHPFASYGAYGRWFNGQFNVNFDKPFVLLELEELTQSEDLKQVVMILILSTIEHKIYISPNREISTLVIFDEAWQLLVGANTASFIEKAYRRFRKYGASIVTITQGISDLGLHPAGNAALKNSSWKFFLQVDEGEIDQATEKGWITINRAERSLMCSTNTVPPYYSEIAYRDPHGIIRLGRLHVDKRTMLLFTTNPLEVALLNRVRKTYNCSHWEAILICEKYIDLLHETQKTDTIMDAIQKNENIESIMA